MFDCLVVAAVKLGVRRKRPVQNQNDMLLSASTVDLFSFPSGHSTRACLAALLLINQYPLNYEWDILLAVWSVAVCLSRVLLGRHHVLDVLCGYLIGALQYTFFTTYLWLGPKTCQQIMQPIQEELHL